MLESIGKCEGMNPHTPKRLPTLGVKVPMDSQIFKGQFQKPKLIGLKFYLYIGKLLEHRYLKWARITHLGTYKHKYGQKKGWESNGQFDSRPLKVRNRLDLLACRWHDTYN